MLFHFFGPQIVQLLAEIAPRLTCHWCSNSHIVFFSSYVRFECTIRLTLEVRHLIVRQIIQPGTHVIFNHHFAAFVSQKLLLHLKSHTRVLERLMVWAMSIYFAAFSAIFLLFVFHPSSSTSSSSSLSSVVSSLASVPHANVFLGRKHIVPLRPV